MLLYATLQDADRHETPEWHPERSSRLGAVDRGLADALCTTDPRDSTRAIELRAATNEELTLVHPESYVEAIDELCAAGGGELDPDTPVSPGSAMTARLAAGTSLAAIEALERGEGSLAFVALRPPGHHATSTRGMGFCLYNNVAVAAAALAGRGERVLIVDWDVHHGNGTQDIFWDDPRVLYVSTHQAPFYPGTGDVSETGGPGAPGMTINLPFPEGATGDVLLRALDEVVAPAVDEFAPTWVLVSAGFDAHRDDPMAGLHLAAGDFADLATRVAAFAPGTGRTALFLEGGYDLGALRSSVAATFGALLGTGIRPEPSTSGGPGASTISAAKRIRDRLIERSQSI